MSEIDTPDDHEPFRRLSEDALSEIACWTTDTPFDEPVLRDLRALVAEVRHLRDMVPAWQPIETAPKDGTDILGWCKFDDVKITWFNTRLKRWRHLEHSQDVSVIWEPTHWMPLPKPPEEP